jgi:hypothetical protein
MTCLKRPGWLLVALIMYQIAVTHGVAEDREDIREKVFQVHKKVGTVRVQLLMEASEPVIKIWKQHAKQPLQILTPLDGTVDAYNLPSLVIEPGDYNFDGYRNFAVKPSSYSHNDIVGAFHVLAMSPVDRGLSASEAGLGYFFNR